MIGLSFLVIPERLWLVIHGFSAYDIVRFTSSRIDGFLLGGLLAIAWRSYNWPKIKVWSRILAPIALIGLFVNVKLGDRYQWVLYSSWSAVFFASIIALCLDLPRGSRLNRILSGKILARIAQYSYAIYFWHLLIGQGFSKVVNSLIIRFHWSFGILPKLLYLPVLFLAIYTVAVVSWNLIEQPLLRLKR